MFDTFHGQQVMYKWRHLLEKNKAMYFKIKDMQ
jgi:hypothetical protein